MFQGIAQQAKLAPFNPVSSPPPRGGSIRVWMPHITDVPGQVKIGPKTPDVWPLSILVFAHQSK